MSPFWGALTPPAMVGTERHAGALPQLPGEIGALTAQIAAAAGEPATTLLRFAAVVATCGRAAVRGSLWSETLPAPAPADTRPVLPAGTLLDAVRWALFQGPARLHHELCLQMAAAGCRLPPALLPQALELGRRSLALREPLLAVLGERGLWLAAQSDEWRYAAGVTDTADDEVAWTDGTFEQRRAFLGRERDVDPAASRERLRTALGELPAKERAELAAVLAVRLGPADESLLEMLRVDRSREVRQAALQLLLRLPCAAHPQRAAARIEALLTQERSGLGKRWQIYAPQAPAGDWKADQVEAARPQHESLGERAWWLYQLVRQVPLSWWTQQTGLIPAELIEWAASTDWTEALLRGWRDVLFAVPDAVWCDALLDRWPVALRDNPASVLALLTPSRRERHLQSRLSEGTEALHATVAQILGACPIGELLSRDTSLLLAARVHERAVQRALNDDYALRAQLVELACALHADALRPLATLPHHPEETPSCAETLHTTLQVVAVRRALRSLSATSTLTPSRIE